MYVGNLNYRVKEGDLEQAMAAYGVVTSVKVIKDRETGKSKGFAFVEMENDAEAAGFREKSLKPRYQAYNAVCVELECLLNEMAE